MLRTILGKFAVPLLAVFAALSADVGPASEPMSIGSRRELFIDNAMIGSLGGDARQVLHHPVAREIAVVHDAPWEGSGCGYHSVFYDPDVRKYRMYYKAWHLEVADGKVDTQSHPLFCCYAESEDGIHWKKPELGLIEFQGSKANNIVLAPEDYGSVASDPGHPAVFRDENPACQAEARYKAVIRARKPHGLLVFQSPDGLHWSLMHPLPVITEGAFDSQNLAFFDFHLGAYRAYWRVFTAGRADGTTWKPAGDRAIRTAVSNDLIHWEPWQDVRYVDSPSEQLYTNVVKPYARAPHLLIGFPTRYVERGWSDSMRALPEPEHREQRAKASLRYGTALTEGLLMSSRDGVTFKRWNEAFLRPGVERNGTWNYGHQYIAWHLVKTNGTLEGAPNELSLYAGESYWTGNCSMLRRYSLRLDGFVSIQAPMSGGELITAPITFSGRALHLNFATSAAGSIRVEILDDNAAAVAGYALDESNELFGDSVDRVVTWKSGSDVGKLAGRPVTLRFVLKDADLYSLWFAP